MIYLGSDHRGFAYKKALEQKLIESKLEFEDCGASSFQADDDFTDYGFKVAERVAVKPDEHQGILICGSGIGMAIAANKFMGVRAGVCWSLRSAEYARLHDFANILVLPADYIDITLAEGIMTTWFATKPLADELRYRRRIDKISAKESELCQR